MKICSRCGIEKRPEEFHPNLRNTSTGLRSHCRSCEHDRKVAWKATHVERYREIRQADYQGRRSKYLANSRKWYYANLEKARAYKQEYRQRPEVKARARLRSKQYRLENLELVAARIANWKKRNPAKVRLYATRRRAANAQIPIDTIEIAIRDEWRCGICGEPIDPTLTFPDYGYRSLDHIVPLSKGGEHSEENVRITHLICNVRRGAGRGESCATS